MVMVQRTAYNTLSISIIGNWKNQSLFYSKIFAISISLVNNSAKSGMAVGAVHRRRATPKSQRDEAAGSPHQRALTITLATIVVIVRASGADKFRNNHTILFHCAARLSYPSVPILPSFLLCWLTALTPPPCCSFERTNVIEFIWWWRRLWR